MVVTKNTPAAIHRFETYPDSALSNVNDSCAYLDISRSKFYRLAHEGKISLVRVGKSTKATIGNLRALATGVPA